MRGLGEAAGEEAALMAGEDAAEDTAELQVGNAPSTVLFRGFARAREREGAAAEGVVVVVVERLSG